MHSGRFLSYSKKKKISQNDHSLSLIVIRCHSLSLAVSRCITLCHWLHQSLSFFVTRCTIRCHSLSLITHLSFGKWSITTKGIKKKALLVKKKHSLVVLIFKLPSGNYLFKFLYSKHNNLILFQYCRIECNGHANYSMFYFINYIGTRWKTVVRFSYTAMSTILATLARCGKVIFEINLDIII